MHPQGARSTFQPGGARPVSDVRVNFDAEEDPERLDEVRIAHRHLSLGRPSHPSPLRELPAFSVIAALRYYSAHRPATFPLLCEPPKRMNFPKPLKRTMLPSIRRR